MALPAEKPLLTVEEYLRLDRAADYKSEYYAGEIFAMSGGLPAHSLISMNAGIALGTRLRGKRCRPYDSNLRIGIPAADLFTYPDLSVFCDPLALLPGTEDVATNPTVIIEVLSRSTEAYDRGLKFELYRRIPSLREYLLISQTAPVIERFTRGGDGRWVLSDARGLEAILPVETLELDLPLAEVFDGVAFSAAVQPRP